MNCFSFDNNVFLKNVTVVIRMKHANFEKHHILHLLFVVITWDKILRNTV